MTALALAFLLAQVHAIPLAHGYVLHSGVAMVRHVPARVRT